jgi:hypothetical protein
MRFSTPPAQLPPRLYLPSTRQTLNASSAHAASFGELDPRLDQNVTPVESLPATQAFSALPPTKLRFIEPMYARLVNELPDGKDWLYEVKFDGYHCVSRGVASEMRSALLNYFIRSCQDVRRDR